MSPALILACICGYFLFLLLIAWYTSRNAGNDAYFLGNRASPWYVVAFGLIGDSLSGSPSFPCRARSENQTSPISRSCLATSSAMR
jgi:hypothetical protein